MPREVVRRHMSWSYDELDEKARGRARELVGEMEYRDLDSDHLSEILSERLESLHRITGSTPASRRSTPRVRLEFSLNHCQGDGVAFYGRVDLKDFFDEGPCDWTCEEADEQRERRARIREVHDRIRAWSGHLVVEIRTVPGLSNHYSHERTMNVQVDEQDRLDFDPESRRRRITELLADWLTAEERGNGMGSAPFLLAIAKAGVHHVPPACDYWDETGILSLAQTAVLRTLADHSEEGLDKDVLALAYLFEEYVVAASIDLRGAGYAEVDYLTSDPDYLAERCQYYEPGFDSEGLPLAY